MVHLANLLVYPLQMMLLAPYYYLGNLLFNTQQNVEFSTLKAVLTEIIYKEEIIMLLDSTLYVVGTWLLISSLMLALLYVGLKPILVKLNSESSRFKYSRR